jgi:hypothetical protein
MSWGRIAVGLRCGYGADPAFVCSWTDLLMGGLRDDDEVLPPACELYHHFTAEQLARRFLAGTCDTILYVDDDMVFEPGDLCRLRDDKRGNAFGILSALYCARRNREPIVYRREADGKAVPVTPAHDAVMDSAFVGLGFCLIRREVLQVLAAAAGPQCLIFSLPPDGAGEDVKLCADAIEAGFKVGVHTGVSIGHRGKTIMRYTPQAKEE